MRELQKLERDKQRSLEFIEDINKKQKEILAEIGENIEFYGGEWKFIPYRCDIHGTLIFENNRIYNMARRKNKGSFVIFDCKSSKIAVDKDKETL